MTEQIMAEQTNPQIEKERFQMQAKWMQVIVMGAVVLLAAPAMVAQQNQAPAKDPSAVTLKGGPDNAPHTWTKEQLLTSTVHEAWVMSGRNEDQFFEMVKELADISAEKRGLTLPETEAAGKQAGELIKAKARKDPDQLLYAVVDYAVKKTGTKAAATTGQ